MGKSQRDKGYRGENSLRKLFIKNGIKCKRMPLSGGVKEYEGDLILEGNELKYKTEVKIRGNGFKSLYKWLEKNDFLFVKADRKNYLAIMDIDVFIYLIKNII